MENLTEFWQAVDKQFIEKYGKDANELIDWMAEASDETYFNYVRLVRNMAYLEGYKYGAADTIISMQTYLSSRRA
jgi:RNA binding exosome subunit